MFTDDTVRCGLTAIVLLNAHTSLSLTLDSQLLTVGGVVLGLVISFRTSSAYERFGDGSRMWTNIVMGSRTLGQLVSARR